MSAPVIDIHETDPSTGYSVVGHMLAELRSSQAGLSAADLAALMGDVSPHTVAQWLRELRVLGLVVNKRVSPGSTRVRWSAT